MEEIDIINFLIKDDRFDDYVEVDAEKILGVLKGNTINKHIMNEIGELTKTDFYLKKSKYGFYITFTRKNM